MIRACKSALSLLLLAVLLLSTAACAAAFEDTRFQGKFTTQNLSAIVEEYELHTGWFWTTKARVSQNYHGRANKPGWTDTAVNVNKKKEYIRGWYGCRWNVDKIDSRVPNVSGWGECYGFVQFLGYLLSGSVNPQSDGNGWRFYENVTKAGGMKVGDIIRIDYKADGKRYQHSAMVYSICGDYVTFIQVSGTAYNKISVNTGFNGANMQGATSVMAFRNNNRGLRIWRSELNIQ